METVSLAQLRRYVVAHQGFATRARTSRRDRRRRGPFAASRLRAARLDLDGRPGTPPDAQLAPRPLPGGFRHATPLRGAHLRVLGPRGLPAADRGLSALQAAHGAPPRPALVGPRAEGPSDRGARPRGDPRARGAPLARLRGPGADARRDVELEARQARARAPLRGRRGRRRRPRRVPAPVRPARAGDPEAVPRRADAVGGRVPCAAMR